MDLKVGRRAWDEYAHPNRPKKFTPPPLVATLTIKQFATTDGRGVVVRLRKWRALRRALKLRPARQPGSGDLPAAADPEPDDPQTCDHKFSKEQECRLLLGL